MTQLGDYDPHDHAERLGVAVEYYPLRASNGLWIPDRKLILIKPRMRALHERSVLAHELGHVCLGHRDDNPRHERQADIFAARHLITPDALARASAASPDAGQWCVDLGVTPHLLETYMKLPGVA